MNFRFSPFGAEYAFRPSWGWLERLYVRLFGLIDFHGRLRARLIIPAVKTLKPQKVLDLGSGTGCYSFYLSRFKGIEVYGVDVDEKRISESNYIAGRLAKRNVKFYNGNEADQLKNFESDSFDLALATEVLQYLPDVRRTLSESHRVLRPGGYLLGHIPVLGYLRPTETILFDDGKTQSLLNETGFQIIKFIPTFGGVVGRLCSAYDRISHLRALVVLLFPLFLLASYGFKVKTQNGDYRFFIARKPSEMREMEQSCFKEPTQGLGLEQTDPQVKRSSRPIGRSSSASAPVSEIASHPLTLTPNGICCAMPLRIGLLMDHPSPHMVSLLDALAERDDCVTQVFYLARQAPGRNWGAPLGRVPHKFIPGISLTGAGRRMNPGLIYELQNSHIDIWVINTCYDSPSTLLAAFWLSRRKKPWVYMNEPPRPRKHLFQVLKFFPIKSVLNRACGVIGMGERAAKIYQDILNGNGNISSVPYYVAPDPFLSLPAPESPQNGQPMNFLTCCQMVRRKGIDILLEACRRLNGKNWRLTLVGEGPLKEKLQTEFRKHFSGVQVFFRGEIPYEKRAEAFAGHHVFVFPSRWDGWGMVVPEALAAGLPVIATDQVVAAHEFIRNGINGFIVPAEDPDALAQKMAYFLQHRERIHEMSLSARESLKDYRPEIGAERLVRFLNKLIREKVVEKEHKARHAENPLTWRTISKSDFFYEESRKTVRQTAKHIGILAGNLIRSRAKPKGHRILVYHLILPEDRERFEDHLKFLRDHFLVSSIPEVIEAAKSPEDARAYRAAISFDDGFRVLMDDCLELLEKHNIQATFFIPTGFVELSDQPGKADQYSLRVHYYQKPLAPMGPEDLRLLVKNGHMVGSHGVSHIGLDSMPQQRAVKELEFSRLRIAEWTGILPEYFAYPYGKSTSSLGKPPEWVREAGYQYAFTLRRGKVDESTDPYLIPRDHIEGNWPVRYLRYFLFKR